MTYSILNTAGWSGECMVLITNCTAGTNRSLLCVRVSSGDDLGGVMDRYIVTRAGFPGALLRRDEGTVLPCDGPRYRRVPDDVVIRDIFARALVPDPPVRSARVVSAGGAALGCAAGPCWPAGRGCGRAG